MDQSAASMTRAAPAPGAFGEERSGRVLYVLTLWGVLGFAAILGRAIWQLAPIAYEPIRDGALSGAQIAVYVLWVAFMLYSEGYKGFQRQLSPRVVARGLHLARHPRLAHALLAPFFCMGLFHATRKRLITSWAVLIGIVGLVVAVRQLDQPWRGIVDGGVVLGLSWGLVAMLVYLVLGLMGRELPVPPDLPESEQPASR
jgi:hypothetical protein